ncbi:MAG: DUF2723 domain-containing protein [Thermoanaerobaculia bacterium]
MPPGSMAGSKADGIAGRELAKLSLPLRFALAFFPALLVYVRTAAPTVYALDSAELTTAAYTGGLVRATGYPLYLLLGRIWSHLLPFGDVGYRMNLLSALCGALTLGLGAVLLGRLGVGGWATFGALALLGGSYWFWALSLVAEVYTLHTLLIVALLLALLAWRRRGGNGTWFGLTFLFGLAMGNHMATGLLAPGCVAFVLMTRGREALRPRALAVAAGGLAAGLSIYLYLPWLAAQSPPFNYAGGYDADLRFHAADLSDPAELFRLATGRSFAPLMMGVSPRELALACGRLLADLWRACAGIGFLPAFLGLRVLSRRDRPLAIATTLFFFAHAAFFLSYRAADAETMFLPCNLVVALWMAFGLDEIFRRLQKAAESSPSRPTWSRAAFAGFVVLFVTAHIAWTESLVALSADDSARRAGEAQFSRLMPGALVLGTWTTVPILQYLQIVEGRRSDVELINVLQISRQDLGRVIRREMGRRPVYVELPPDAVVLGVDFGRGGPLRRARASARELTSGANRR